MSEFSRAVALELEGLGPVAPGVTELCPACPDPSDFPDLATFHDEAKEPSFSWSSCDSCGSRLGGDRHPAHAFDDEGGLYHLDICTDCVHYHANGDEPEEWSRTP